MYYSPIILHLRPARYDGAGAQIVFWHDHLAAVPTCPQYSLALLTQHYHALSLDLIFTSSIEMKLGHHEASEVRIIGQGGRPEAPAGPDATGASSPPCSCILVRTV